MFNSIRRSFISNTNLKVLLPLYKQTRFMSEVVVSFKNASFEYIHDKPILDEVNFSVKSGTKVTIMGQNGSGKSTILKLLNKTIRPSEGLISAKTGLVVSTALQVMPRENKDISVLEYFTKQLHGNDSGISSRISKVLQDVELIAPLDRKIGSFSGGQQARLLLAAALIMEPEILLLDEPTNNLDTKGIELLTSIIQQTDKTVVVISHDEDFLNSFSDSVLYLDVFSKKVEQYEGDYHTVKSEIAKRIRQENAENSRLQRQAQAKKDQANVFANKGGGMRKVAKKMRDLAEELQDKVVNVRKEDKSLAKFIIPYQSNSSKSSNLMKISGITLPGNGRTLQLKGGPISFDKGTHMHLYGPNGIGKTTLLEDIVNNRAEGVYINPKASIGYYRQDFNNLDFESTVLSCLEEASDSKHSNQEIRTLAASFFLRGEIVKQHVCTLSEGQKGLVSLACLVLQEPAILILDEPTNHINFRHLKALASALNTFEGALIVVSHDEDFISQVKVDTTLDLGFESS
jgi:ATPase subunit of ABC transporter with duplicated ATPase domains